MIRNKITALILLTLVTVSCDRYLDIVPDKTQEVSLLFQRQEAAYKALVTCYHYLPMDDAVYSTYAFASDMLTTPVEQETPGVEMMRGKQSTSDPLMGYWAGHYANGRSQESLFRAIRDCNIFIDHIGEVMDMTDQEKATWKAEAIFLKAYYHFLLLRQYGPVPIVDHNLAIDASEDAVRVRRDPVDQVFDYIVKTIDLAMKNLPERNTAANDIGRVDKVVAAAVKSRVLLYAASPLYNGNSDYYETFTGKDGEKFFNTTYDPEKWKLAADAAKEAIDLALASGVEMYTYNDVVPAFDSTAYDSAEVKALYNYRYMFTDKWNKELIWGNSNPVDNGDWWTLQAAAMMINPDASSNYAAWQWVSPTLQAAEMYYTKNGLPIDEDLSFTYDRRYSVTVIPPEEGLHAQVGEVTANLHLNREPRFYASIGFDRGINRTWGTKWNLKMRKGEDYGRRAMTNDYVITGYVLKKTCHPSSIGEDYNKLVVYPWPIIRLAELYLNYAEASNEYYGPSQDVYDALNIIRERSGVPDIEVAWSDPAFVKDVDKHLTKDGLRDIVRQERSIELAFEGQRYYDVRRWKKASEYFNTPVKGWSVDESTINKFYTVKSVGQRSFITPRDYLQPIPVNELIINSNLVQNPGW
ncbi:MAG TPA: RagB/SusD family nutrient uptake outer membrane protein [Bacteroidales bacterium]|nr:RagB/SusD family nutrient uptake outer membrane protein [Bacteroidales bacterium]